MGPNGVRSAIRAYLAVPLAQTIVRIGALVLEISHVFRVARSEHHLCTSMQIDDFRAAILVVSAKFWR